MAEPPKATYNPQSKQWLTGQEAASTAAKPAAGADFSKLNDQILWDAFLKQNNIIPPFGGGGQAFKDKHLLPFMKFKQQFMIGPGGKVIPVTPAQSPGPAPLATPAPVPVPTPTPTPDASKPTISGSVNPDLMRKLLQNYYGDGGFNA